MHHLISELLHHFSFQEISDIEDRLSATFSPLLFPVSGHGLSKPGVDPGRFPHN
jgi:hypothetical protein